MIAEEHVMEIIIKRANYYNNANQKEEAAAVHLIDWILESMRKLASAVKNAKNFMKMI